MDQVEIVQIAIGEGGIVHGLGRDNKVYRWNNVRGDWSPYWNNYASGE